MIIANNQKLEFKSFTFGAERRATFYNYIIQRFRIIKIRNAKFII